MLALDEIGAELDDGNESGKSSLSALFPPPRCGKMMGWREIAKSERRDREKTDPFWLLLRKGSLTECPPAPPCYSGESADPCRALGLRAPLHRC